VAGFGTRAGRPLQGRGGSPGFRFALYALLSIVIMVLDQRFDWLERAHYLLQAATYPVEVAVNFPVTAWRWVDSSFAARASLEAENHRLHERLRALELRSMRFDALARENAALLGLRAALPPVASRWLPADIVNLELDSLHQRVLIDRGSSNGVMRGQAVLDDHGVVGQTEHVGPWSTEVILITDPADAIPVQIERTGLRTIAVGAGDATSLALPYLPANADIRIGDVLVTSGLGGVFPAGYPVARVTQVHRDAVQPLAHVRARPFAHLETDREVMLVWFHGESLAAPLAHGGRVSSGNPDIQPQRPPRRSAAPAAKPAVPGSKPASRAGPKRSAGAPRHPAAAHPAGAHPARRVPP
jgi:rod shape-determining protein MreC